MREADDVVVVGRQASKLLDTPRFAMSRGVAHCGKGLRDTAALRPWQTIGLTARSAAVLYH
jgi:hypothetical protein